MIKKLLRKWLIESDPDEKCMALPAKTNDDFNKPGHSIRFTLTEADGGYIINFHTYNHKTDRESGGVYVRPGNCDLGKEIEQIVMMEKLKQ